MLSQPIRCKTRIAHDLVNLFPVLDTRIFYLTSEIFCLSIGRRQSGRKSNEWLLKIQERKIWMEEVVVCAEGQCFVFVQSQLSKLKMLTKF